MTSPARKQSREKTLEVDVANGFKRHCVTDPVPVENSQEVKELIADLRIAAKQPVTPDERFKRTVTFVHGNLPSNVDMTREDVERILRR